MAPGGQPTDGTAPWAIRAAWRLRVLALVLGLLWGGGLPVLAGNTFTWQTNRNRVSADLHSESLLHVLGQVAQATGWQVYMDPHALRNVSAKFSDLPPGEALRLLLGDLNFALVPAVNARSKLYVFHTSMAEATQLVAPDKGGPRKPTIIPNELIVRLKPGVKIEELAKLLGAKVLGKIDGLNAYRLQFEDANAAAAAASQLANNPDVASVENNYTVYQPGGPQALLQGTPSLHLQLDPPPANGRVTIGLVDTAVQPLGNGLDAFLEPQLSVAGQAQLDPNTPSHGTAMAETMLNTLQGLSDGHTSVQILPVDVYGPNESTTTFQMAVGIQTAINNGANPINVSSGTTDDSPIMRDLISAAYAQGIMIYASKGNDGGTEPVYPAAYPGVTAVTALDPSGQPSFYANKAPIPAVGASGTSIIPFGTMTWVVEGTSPAAAVTSATAAQIAASGSMTAVAANSQVVQKPTATTSPHK